MRKIQLVVLMGPTASGKTSMAVEICKKYGGEVERLRKIIYW